MPDQTNQPQAGIDATEQVVDAAIAVEQAAKQVLADGKVDLSDAGAVLALLPQILPALESIGKVLPELKDLSADEAAQLGAHVLAKLGIQDARTALIVEKAVKFAVAGYDLVVAVKG